MALVWRYFLTIRTVRKSKENKFPKTHPKHWEKRVFRKTYSLADGTITERDSYMVRLQFDGQRREVGLETGDRREAAKRAMELYFDVRKKGWDALLPASTFNTQIKESPTVGDIIERFEACHDVARVTARDYVSSFRKVAAWIGEIPSDNKRYDYCNGGVDKWKKKVDAIHLSQLTRFKMQKWKRFMIESAEGDPLKEQSRQTSTNSDLRRIKCIFSKNNLEFMKDLNLPPKEELPGHSTKMYKVAPKPYRSVMDLGLVLREGKAELRKSFPEQYKILLLAVCAGLRRDEIDKLQWSSIDFEKFRVRVELSEYFAGKSAHSISKDDGIPISGKIAEELKELRAETFGDFVLVPDKRKPFIPTHKHYRAHQQFRELIKWLRTKGVNSSKPIHELRKEAGYQMNKKAGIQQASAFLRHSSVITTEKHYIDPKVNNPLPIEEILASRSKAS